MAGSEAAVTALVNSIPDLVTFGAEVGSSVDISQWVALGAGFLVAGMDYLPSGFDFSLVPSAEEVGEWCSGISPTNTTLGDEFYYIGADELGLSINNTVVTTQPLTGAVTGVGYDDRSNQVFVWNGTVVQYFDGDTLTPLTSLTPTDSINTAYVFSGRTYVGSASGIQVYNTDTGSFMGLITTQGEVLAMDGYGDALMLAEQGQGITFYDAYNLTAVRRFGATSAIPDPLVLRQFGQSLCVKTAAEVTQYGLTSYMLSGNFTDRATQAGNYRLKFDVRNRDGAGITNPQTGEPEPILFRMNLVSSPITSGSVTLNGDCHVGENCNAFFAGNPFVNPNGGTPNLEADVSSVDGVVFDGSTFRGTPTQAGNYTVAMTVSNPYGSVTQEVNFVVGHFPLLDPQWSMDKLFVPMGTFLSFQFNSDMFSDPDGHALSWTVTYSPTTPLASTGELTFHPNNRTLTGWPTGSADLRVSVDDSTGGRASHDFSVITGSPLVMELGLQTELANTVIDVNQPVFIPVALSEISDGSGRNPSITLQGAPAGWRYDEAEQAIIGPTPSVSSGSELSFTLHATHPDTGSVVSQAIAASVVSFPERIGPRYFDKVLRTRPGGEQRISINPADYFSSGTTLTFSLSNHPEWLSLEILASGEINVIAQPGEDIDVSNQVVNLRGTDPTTGAMVDLPITVSVGVNRAPVIQPQSNLEADYGKELEFSFENACIDEDGDVTSLSFSYQDGELLDDGEVLHVPGSNNITVHVKRGIGKKIIGLRVTCSDGSAESEPIIFSVEGRGLSIDDILLKGGGGLGALIAFGLTVIKLISPILNCCRKGRLTTKPLDLAVGMEHTFTLDDPNHKLAIMRDTCCGGWERASAHRALQGGGASDKLSFIPEYYDDADALFAVESNSWCCGLFDWWHKVTPIHVSNGSSPSPEMAP